MLAVYNAIRHRNAQYHCLLVKYNSDRKKLRNYSCHYFDIAQKRREKRNSVPQHPVLEHDFEHFDRCSESTVHRKQEHANPRAAHERCD